MVARSACKGSGALDIEILEAESFDSGAEFDCSGAVWELPVVELSCDWG